MPVFSFGENELFQQFPSPPGSWVRRAQEAPQRALSVALPLFHRRLGLLLPFRTRVYTVGEPGPARPSVLSPCRLPARGDEGRWLGACNPGRPRRPRPGGWPLTTAGPGPLFPTVAAGGREGERQSQRRPSPHSAHSRGPNPGAAAPAAQRGAGGRAARAVRGEARRAVRRAQGALRGPSVTGEGGLGIKGGNRPLVFVCLCSAGEVCARASAHPRVLPPPSPPGRSSGWPRHSGRPSNRSQARAQGLFGRTRAQTAAGAQSSSSPASSQSSLRSGCLTSLAQPLPPARPALQPAQAQRLWKLKDQSQNSFETSGSKDLLIHNSSCTHTRPGRSRRLRAGTRNPSQTRAGTFLWVLETCWQRAATGIGVSNLPAALLHHENPAEAVAGNSERLPCSPNVPLHGCGEWERHGCLGSAGGKGTGGGRGGRGERLEFHSPGCPRAKRRGEGRLGMRVSRRIRYVRVEERNLEEMTVAKTNWFFSHLSPRCFLIPSFIRPPLHIPLAISCSLLGMALPRLGHTQPR